MIEILVNGESRRVGHSYTVAELINELGLVGRRLAVEINLEIVPRSAHADRQLCPGDKVEIVHAIGGG